MPTVYIAANKEIAEEKIALRAACVLRMAECLALRASHDRESSPEVEKQGAHKQRDPQGQCLRIDGVRSRAEEMKKTFLMQSFKKEKRKKV